MQLSETQVKTMLSNGMTMEQISKEASSRGDSLPQKSDWLDKASNLTGSLFAGKHVGTAIGRLAGYGLTKASEATGLPIAPGGPNGFFHTAGKGESQYYNLNGPSPLRVAGDVALGTAQVAGAKLPIASSMVGKAAQFGALGAISGGAKAIAEGQNRRQVLQETGKGGTVGILSGLAFGTLEKASSALSKGGQKIQYGVVKPSMQDVKDGFKVDTINKYNLGGSLQQTAEKTQAKMNELTRQLNAKLLAGSGDVSKQLKNTLDTFTLRDIQILKKEMVKIPTTVKKSNDARNALKNTLNLRKNFPVLAVDIGNVYQNVEKKLLGAKLQNFGTNTRMANALEQLRNEVMQTTGKNGLASIPEAQVIKQAAGYHGAWQFGKQDPESTALQTVYNTFYSELKSQIEKASPDGVKEINKQLGELIPVMRAVIRRIPVAERNSPLSLTDVISLSAGAFEPRAFSLAIANRASKSGRVGAGLYKLGGGLQKGIQGIEKLQQATMTHPLYQANPAIQTGLQAPQIQSYNNNTQTVSKVNIPQSSRLAHVNNNPGNLRFAGQAGAVKGEKGFARFSTPEAGFKALKNQIALDAKRGLNLAQFVAKYAPPSENNTTQYIKQVIKATGASAKTPLHQVSLDKLAMIISKKESSTSFG